MRLSYCGRCGKKLSGRQVLWCSAACANAAWQKEHQAERNAARRAERAGNKPPSLRDQVAALTKENRQLKGLCVTCETPLKPGQVMHCSPDCANAEWEADRAATAKSNAAKRAALDAALKTKGGSK